VVAKKVIDALPTSVKEQLRTTRAKGRAIADILRSSDYIFYQSHMRAYTTLVSHILASNPDVNGYMELHRSYRNPADLVIMRQQLLAATKDGVVDRSRYKLDKLLHNGNTVATEVAVMSNVRSVFSLRHPSETLPSIVQMVEKTGEQRTYGTPEGATEYYVKRVRQLVDEASRPGAGLYFDAELIVSDTDRLLRELAEFLSLKVPLRSEYDTFDQTGKEGTGDPSAHITTGAIVRNRPASSVAIPAELIERASDAYRDARTSLIEHCSASVTTEDNA
jgi:hypothetical protein